MPKKRKKMYGGGMMPPADSQQMLKPSKVMSSAYSANRGLIPSMNVGMMGGGYVKRYAEGGGVRKVRY